MERIDTGCNSLYAELSVIWQRQPWLTSSLRWHWTVDGEFPLSIHTFTWESEDARLAVAGL
jgi:hypothetical protein